MILNNQYKIYAQTIAGLFCKNDALCRASVYQRIVNYFSDTTFEHFLQNIQQGRWYSLKYSNWHTGNTCRDVLIDVRLVDVITGVVQAGYWNYTNQNCDDKKYYYPDLNTLISRMNYTLKDNPIMNKTNAEVTKERLVWKPSAQPYGITYVTPLPGSNEPPFIPTPSRQPEPMQNTPVTKEAGFNFESLTSNPILLIGGAALLFFFLMKK